MSLTIIIPPFSFLLLLPFALSGTVVFSVLLSLVILALRLQVRILLKARRLDVILATAMSAGSRKGRDRGELVVRRAVHIVQLDVRNNSILNRLGIKLADLIRRQERSDEVLTRRRQSSEHKKTEDVVRDVYATILALLAP